MIRINQLKLPVQDDESNLEKLIRKALRLHCNEDFTYHIVKRSIDARHRNNILHIYSVDVKLKNTDESALVRKVNNNNIMLSNEKHYEFPVSNISGFHGRIIIAGSGPAGLFCGLFLERYSDFLVQRQIGPIFRHRFRHPKAFPGAPDLFAAVVLPVVVERRYIPAVPLLPQVDLAVEIIFHAIVPQPF